MRHGRRHSAALCHPLPSFFHAAPLERVRQYPREAYSRRPGDRAGRCRDAGWAKHIPPSPPAQCGHPRPCAATSDAVEPSPALWEPVPMGCRHARLPCSPNSPISRTLESVYEQQPDAGAGKTTLEATSRQAQELPRCTQEPGPARTTIKSQALHAGTGIPHQKSCDTFVSRLPSAYKRRRWPPSRGNRTTTRSLASTSTFPLILALCLNHPAETWGFSSSPTLPVAPLYKHPCASQYSAHAQPAGRMAPWPESG
jgi:hypothetical protein